MAKPNSDNEEDNQHLPEDLKHPGSKEWAPGSSDSVYNPERQSPGQSPEGLGLPKPDTKVVCDYREKNDVLYILKSYVS